MNKYNMRYMIIFKAVHTSKDYPFEEQYDILLN